MLPALIGSLRYFPDVATALVLVIYSHLLTVLQAPHFLQLQVFSIEKEQF